MNKGLMFLSWFFVIVSSITIGFRLFIAIAYEGSVQQTYDNFRGIKRTWPIGNQKYTLLLAVIYLCLYYT